MYRREFEQLLAGRIPKAILLFGDDHFHIDHFAKVIEEKLQASESKLQLFFDEYNFDAAKGFLSQSSLFGGANLLIVKHDKKISKKEMEQLIALCNKNDESYLLYLFLGSAKDAKSLQPLFNEKKGGVWVRFFEPTPAEAMATAVQIAGRIGVEIDKSTLQHLLITLHNDLSLLSSELEKFYALNRPINSSDIDRLTYATTPIFLEEFFEKLFLKQDALAFLDRLLEQGEDIFALLRAMQRYIEQIFLFQAYMKLHGAIDSKAILGYKLPKRIEEQKARVAMRIKSSSLLKICEVLFEGELEMKQSAGTQKEALFYGLVVRAQACL